MTRNTPQHLDISVSVKVDFGTKIRSSAAVKALIPDNVSFPEGLSVEMFARGSEVVTQVRGKNVPMKTILGTVDEILEHLSVCQKVLPK